MNNIIFDFAKSLSEEKKYLNFNRITNSKEIYHYTITEDYHDRLKGDYYIIKNLNDDLDFSFLIKDLTKIISKILRKYKIRKVLVIGLGNEDVPCDSLGKQVTDNIIATNEYNNFYTTPKIYVFDPETYNKTGIKSFSIISMLVKFLKPDALIMIDSLLTNNKMNLNNTIEISDAGIIQGFYLKDTRKIDSNTFGIPIISIGVSLAIKIEKNIYTSPIVSQYVERYGILIAKSLNKIFLST